jgi:hypothetical protein
MDGQNNIIVDKVLLDVQDVQKLLNIKKERAYMVMRKCNQKLERMGKMTIKGRVNRQFLIDSFCVDSKMAK